MGMSRMLNPTKSLGILRISKGFIKSRGDIYHDELNLIGTITKW